MFDAVIINRINGLKTKESLIAHIPSPLHGRREVPGFLGASNQRISIYDAIPHVFTVSADSRSAMSHLDDD